MLQRLTVGKKIFGGFVIVLALLCLIAVRSYNALQDSSDGFARYRALARTSALATHLQENWLKLRNSVKDFIITGKDEVLAEYQGLDQGMTETLGEAARTITDQDRARLLADAGSKLSAYREGFASVVASKGERDRLVEEVLDYEGSVLEQKLSMLQTTAMNKGALEEAFLAAEASRSLLLGQLFGTKYLQTTSEDDLLRTRQEFEGLMDIFGDMDELVQDAQRRLWFDQAREAAGNYTKGFEDIAAVLTARNKTISEVLDTVGPAMAGDIDALAGSVLAEQDRLGPELQAANGRAVNLVLIIGLVSVALGLVAAVLITRGLTRPLRRTTRAAEEVASGNMDVSIEPEGGDEIADLQRALASMLATIRANYNTYS